MTAGQAPAPASAWWPRIAGALLALAVAAVHVVDQGGLPGSKTPASLSTSRPTALAWRFTP